MAIKPSDIQAQVFSEAKRGYDPAEVDVFLERLAAEVDAMLNKIVDLKTRLTDAEQQLAEANARLAEAESAPVPQPQPAAVPAEYTATASQISAALISAQQSADAIIAEARDNADRIRNDADAKAREVIRQALAEKQNEINEIDRLKASREEFRAEYIKLIQHFMDDAQDSFPEDILSNTPTGSEHTEDVSPMETAPMAVPAEAVEPQPVADPFAPLDNFAVDDLD